MAVPALVACTVLLLSTGGVAVPSLPILTQPVRSDWLNVKLGCVNGTKAIGDGTADDTAALQACFDALSAADHNTPTASTVYMPPGRYVIKKTLVLHDWLGMTLIGTGETTVLVWKGAAGHNSTMIWSDGISRSRLMGFVLDGTAGCDIGVDHASNHSLFETRLRHQNQKFLGFGQAGIRVGGHKSMLESAEIIYENCIFDSIGHACKGLPFPPMSQSGCGAVTLLNFNDYDNVFDGCEFSNNAAKFAGALRINDIGDALIEDSLSVPPLSLCCSWSWSSWSCPD